MRTMHVMRHGSVYETVERSVPIVRPEARAVRPGWDLPLDEEALDCVLLIINELVANTVRHACG